MDAGMDILRISDVAPWYQCQFGKEQRQPYNVFTLITAFSSFLPVSSPPVVLDSNPVCISMYLFVWTCLRILPSKYLHMYPHLVVIHLFMYHQCHWLFCFSVVCYQANPESPCDTKSVFTPNIDPPLQSPLLSTLKHSDIDHNLLKWN